ncbi:hypothetical protein [Candidatus Methylomirabilis sp.]|uniref:hypothetical protein n=1 Tax=Candidatus Methylomirabilis sp. TaxID=2032687 RepID=UPI003C78D422
MRRFSKPKAVLLVTAVVVTMVAAVCVCPFGLMANAQMATMMDHDMGAQTTDGMCPMLCGAPPYTVGVEPNGFVLGLLLIHPVLNPTPPVRPIFHPPTLA